MRRRYFLAAGFAGVGASVLGCPFVSADSGAFPFTHGVASGDPDQRGFLAWTRHIPRCDGPTTLVAEVAERENFEKVLLRQEVIAAPWHDYCVTSRFKNLESGRWYYYRFRGPDGSISPIGRSRTLPRGPTDRFRVAVVGCSNATSGWFNAYAHLAERDDIDLVVHLGDYIYESALTRSDAIPGLARKRAIQPVHKCASLNDYRLRYASYRSDPDLARLHQRFPFIVMMDDHESANNTWHGGADGHNAVSEGRWHLRMDAALKAFHEWLPVNPGLYNRFDVGDLASLIRLETRLLGRTRKIELPHGLTEPEGRGNGLRRALSTFRREIDDPHRTMLGREQEDWLDRQQWHGLQRELLSHRLDPGTGKSICPF